MKRKKPTDVEKRLGVYKHIENVPYRSRLERFESQFDQRDVWAMFFDARNSAFDSVHYEATFHKAEKSFKSHMRTCGRHHALARPDDIETWLSSLAETRTLGTVYSEYWVRVEEFYTWLQHHTEFPHVYNPVWMAAATYSTAGAMWSQKTTTSQSHAEEE